MTLHRLQRVSRLRSCAWLLALVIVGAGFTLAPRPASAQEHAAPAAEAGTPQAAESRTSEGAHEEGLLTTIAKLVNFAVLAAVLVYFLKSPVTGYLASRATQIRQDLVSAREMRSAAGAQLAEVERRLQELPGELAALRARGAEDLRAEQARITGAVAAERARLVEHTRREIDMSLRIARHELTEHAAQLAVSIAGHRIRRSITADDQLRLIDRYTSQLEEAR